METTGILVVMLFCEVVLCTVVNYKCRDVWFIPILCCAVNIFAARPYLPWKESAIYAIALYPIYTLAAVVCNEMGFELKSSGR